MRSAPETFARVLVAGLVLSQRLVLPVGSVQVSLVMGLSLVAIIIGARRGLLVMDADRTRLYLAAVVAIVLASLVHVVLQLPMSWMSLAFLVILYLPACWVVRDLSRDDVDGVLWFFVRLMTVLAGIGVVVFALQFVGVAYQDWLAHVVPPTFLQRAYVTSYPIFYGSSIYRANGVIFLEPSFFSYFTGLALLVMLYLGRRGPHLFVLTAALVCSLSGNGFVVLAGGGLVMLFQRGRRGLLLRLAPPLAAVLVLAAFTPIGQLLLGRLGETGNPQSSSSLRMVQPYLILLPEFASSMTHALLGQGASSADSYAQAINLPGLLAPVIPKLLFEYGLVAALVFIGFLLFSIFWHPMALPVSVALALAYFVVNAGLLQPTMALTTLLFTSVLRPAVPEVVRAQVLIFSARAP